MKETFRKFGRRALTVLLSASMMAGFTVPVWAGEAEDASDAPDPGIQAYAEGDVNIGEAAYDEMYGVLTTDGTLTIAYGSNTEEPAVGETYNGSQVMETYSKISTDGYLIHEIPWYESRGDIVSVVFDKSLEDNTAEPVNSTEDWFYDCYNLENIDIEYFDTSELDSMDYMFYNCYALTDLGALSDLDVSNVSTMKGTFFGCSGLTDVDGLSKWDTGNVVAMNRIFEQCDSLTDVSGITGWDLSGAEILYGMFYGCSGLTSIDVSGWDTSKVTDIRYMFSDCTNLATVYSDDSVFVTTSVIYGTSMFEGCSNITGGCGTSYDPDKTDASMAHIDRENDHGYFTETGHRYEFDAFSVSPSWDEWTEDWTKVSNSDLPTVKAVFKCADCGAVEEVNVDIMINAAETYDPTCESAGQISVTGTVEFDGMAETYSSGIITIGALGHDYVAVDSDSIWSDDNTMCDIKLVCSRCGQEHYIEGCQAEAEKTQTPTCTTDGETTYTASGSYNGIFYIVHKTETIPAYGHDWDYEHPVDFDYSSMAKEGYVVVTVECKVCGATTTENYQIEYEVLYVYNPDTDEYKIDSVVYSVNVYDPETDTVYTFWSSGDAEQMFSDHNWVEDALGCSEPTCTVNGYKVWYCTDCGAVRTEVEPAAGHDWDMSDYSHTWSPDYQSCVFTFTCKTCGAEETVDAEITSISSNGRTTYTAVCTFNGKTLSTNVTVNALGQTENGTGSGLGDETVGSTKVDTKTNDSMLGDSTVGNSSRTTAMAQSDDTAAETVKNPTSTIASSAEPATVSNTSTAGTVQNASRTSETGTEVTDNVKTGSVSIFAIIAGIVCVGTCDVIAVAKRKKKVT